MFGEDHKVPHVVQLDELTRCDNEGKLSQMQKVEPDECSSKSDRTAGLMKNLGGLLQIKSIHFPHSNVTVSAMGETSDTGHL